MNSTIKIAIFVFCAWLFCLPVGARADIPSLDQLLTLLRNRYKQVDDLSANFVQTTKVKTISKDQKAEGKAYFKRPGKMRFDYETPPKKSFISDGSTLWMHSVDEKKYLKSPMPKDQGADVPMEILAGNIDLSTKFDASILGMDEGKAMLELRPKTESSYRKVILYIDSVSGELYKSVITDLYGNDVTMLFSNIKINQKLSDSVFVVKPGPGEEIISSQ